MYGCVLMKVYLPRQVVHQLWLADFWPRIIPKWSCYFCPLIIYFPCPRASFKIINQQVTSLTKPCSCLPSPFI